MTRASRCIELKSQINRTSLYHTTRRHRRSERPFAQGGCRSVEARCDHGYIKPEVKTMKAHRVQTATFFILLFIASQSLLASDVRVTTWNLDWFPNGTPK